MEIKPQRMGKGRRSKEDLDVEYWVEGDGIAQVREWIREKKTDAEIAALIGMNRCTLAKWKKVHKTFGTLFKIERQAAVPELLQHAYQHAIGYYKEVEQVDGQGRIVKVKQWFPGNPQLMQFFLKNWDSRSYRDKWDIDLGGKLPVVLTSDDQIPD